MNATGYISALLLAGLFVVFPVTGSSAEKTPDPERDILVTFDNHGARAGNGGLGAPYSHRKRYSVARSVRRAAADVATRYRLVEIENWPIRALSIYCVVFRIPDGVERTAVIDALATDKRVESVQVLQRFETNMAREESHYDDTYAGLQYGLEILGIAAAHKASTGKGVRIAIIDGDVDRNHEDLKGRIDRSRTFSGKGTSVNVEHGTAVASVIGARSNNARGIVGIAPQASLELFVSCWGGGNGQPATCDSFSLSKALDTMLENPPQILNLSLNGPQDPLLERLLTKTAEAGVVIVAAGSGRDSGRGAFPSSMDCVLGVHSSVSANDEEALFANLLYAPGDRILVAVPTDQYDFRSGSSLAAAHVSGVIALLLAVAPDLSPDSIHRILVRSQDVAGPALSINACQAMNLATGQPSCSDHF